MNSNLNEDGQSVIFDDDTKHLSLFWLQILESSQTLLHVLKKETGKDRPQPSHSQGSVRDKTGTQTT